MLVLFVIYLRRLISIGVSRRAWHAIDSDDAAMCTKLLHVILRIETIDTENSTTISFERSSSATIGHFECWTPNFFSNNFRYHLKDWSYMLSSIIEFYSREKFNFFDCGKIRHGWRWCSAQERALSNETIEMNKWNVEQIVCGERNVADNNRA